MNTSIIENIQHEMQDFFTSDSTGHDWYHIDRVWKNAKRIARYYPEANHLHIELAALLHDRYDRKLVPDASQARQEVQQLLLQQGVEKDFIFRILYTIDAVSFKNGANPVQARSIEDKIVQDADRLDALGAIGIARTFAYSGAHHRPIYQGEEANSPADTAIAHFYDKLLTLQEKLHTPEAKEIAKGRHQFMLNYLEQFYAEWHSQK